MPTSSADPGRLQAAAMAVDPALRQRLAQAPQRVHDAMSRFVAGPQSPRLVTVDPDLPNALSGRVAEGQDIDTFLARVAAAFREADLAPGGPTTVRVLDDSVLGAALAAWDCPPATEFRQREDGTIEVLGPDGYWYVVSDQPPEGAPPLGPPREETVDFGNPDWGLALSAGALGLGAAAPVLQPAPPEAYDYVHFADDGTLVVGPGSADPPIPPRPPAHADGAIELVQGALAGLNQYAAAQYDGVFRTQTTFYVDPRTGERFAVVDAATVSYADDGTAHVTAGRLTVDEDGEPTLIPMPAASGEDCDPAELQHEQVPPPEDG